MIQKYVRPEAVAWIEGDGEHPDLRGMVELIPHYDGVQVVARIRGLPETETNFFAIHIHEGGDCGGEGFSDTGGHFGPGKLPHPRHAGDLPPLLSRGGSADMAVVTDRFRIGDVIGKTVVIHSDPDDFRTQPAGAAGSKIACGVIRKY